MVQVNSKVTSPWTKEFSALSDKTNALFLSSLPHTGRAGGIPGVGQGSRPMRARGSEGDCSPLSFEIFQKMFSVWH